ncbi:sulfite exporter TauE/SafE family protein [Caldimonas tepidiphila]|uniref:sulfite exporter TauE/SafE family protein n=1 Tax=Caldimonas tepidiphila TaxID=2315841 RepID=UPI000E5A6960|nr:sulfite exporter TauE/SafE family protein [Caldimonas tepidiphila]
MTLFDAALIALGAFAAGAVNSIAGGGTFFSFPALLAVGVPPVVANASNSVSLWPGSLSGAWAYKRELVPLKRYLLPMGVASFIGGICGGLLLLLTKDATFKRLIPWLLAFATLLFAFSGQISAALRRWRKVAPGAATRPRGGALGWLGQLLVSIYGGFFGAGMGILMMASLAIAGHEDVQEINAIKNLLSAVIYSVTVVTFIVAGAVSWPHTLVMIVTATLGGYAGASMARRVPALWLRRAVIATGVLLTLYYFQAP